MMVSVIEKRSGLGPRNGEKWDFLATSWRAEGEVGRTKARVEIPLGKLNQHSREIGAVGKRRRQPARQCPGI